MNVETYTFDGVTLFVRSNDPDDKYANAEVRTYDIGPDEVRTCLDIGAHIGTFTCWINHLWPNSQIIAIEPEQHNFEILAMNIPLRDECRAWNTRITYDQHEAWLVVHPDHSTCHKIVGPDEKPTSLVTVPVFGGLSLEDVMNRAGWQTLDLLKIDCEGCELDVLMNCTSDALLRTRRIVGEFHYGFDHFMNGIGQRLQHLGFLVDGQRDPLAHSTFVGINQKALP